MHDDHVGRDGPGLDLAGSAAALHQARVGVVGDGQELVAGGQHRSNRGRGIIGSDVGGGEQLDLGDHPRGIAVGREPAAGPDHLRRVGGRGDHRGLLDAHRYEHVAAVDPEVGGDRQRQLEGADDVLDHVVGPVHVEGSHVEIGEPGRGQAGGVGDRLPAIVDRQLEESGETRAHRHPVLGAQALGVGAQIGQARQAVLATQALAEAIEVGPAAGEHHHEVAPAGPAGLGREPGLGGLAHHRLDRRGHDWGAAERGESAQTLVVQSCRLGEGEDEGARVVGVGGEGGLEPGDGAHEALHRVAIGGRIAGAGRLNPTQERAGHRRRARVDEADVQVGGQTDAAGLALDEPDRPADDRRRHVGSAAASALGLGVGGQGEAQHVAADLVVARVEAGRGEVVADHRGRDRGARAQAELAGTEREAAGLHHGGLSGRVGAAGLEIGRGAGVGADHHRARGAGAGLRRVGDCPHVDGGDERRAALEHGVLADEERLAGSRDGDAGHGAPPSTRASGPGAQTVTASTPEIGRRRSARASAVSAAHRTLTWGPASMVA